MRRFLLVIQGLLLAAVLAYAGDLEDANEYFLGGQYRKAITSYERALSSAPNKTQIYYNLGVCYEKLGNLERAVSYYRKAGGLKDAAARADRLQTQLDAVKAAKVSKLKDEAQRAYEAMNYGTARSKAKEILRLDPSNSWARSLLKTLEEAALPAETTAIAVPETTAAPEAETLGVADTVSVAPQPGFPSPLYIVIGAAILAAAAGIFFLIGRASKGETVERAMRTLIRLLPAGMLSVRGEKKISLLFFEEGKVIKAIVEEPDGVKIGGRSVAEELLGTSCPYDDKPTGPWSRFAELMIEVYRRAQVEAAPPPSKRSKRKRK